MKLRLTYFPTIEVGDVTPSTITPELTYPSWEVNSQKHPTLEEELRSVYLLSITERLKYLIPRMAFEDVYMHGALLACAYDLATHGPGYSPWGDAFTNIKITDFEHVLNIRFQLF